ncbi:MarR family transcriptional regulator [Planotetraspora sp. A-T 1434]|uniref:MarR family winged helix-turn-helix transcriptional regulator n=1 Tax=Planotetraspora sp. A-T 1434 TaxID=2979219 RepID=UPI0021BF8E49|nr:MarR family transcriptional regulator [Planotetraspora sp. A-T 1434]MCT9931712.1 MarR family transcriptional regulator [Planotetraspora sp. A-T 1434]
MEIGATRLRAKASWLINKTSLHAHRLVAEGLGSVDARGYHFAILAALDEYGPASQAAVSQRTGIDRSDTVAMVNELVDQRLVVRAPDPDDRRRNVITITPAGRRRLEQLETVLSEVQDELLAPLSAAERRQLVGLLARVLDHHTSQSG